MDGPEDLVRLCSMALVMGLDFAAIWRTILRLHPLVVAASILSTEHAAAEVLLTTGDRLVVDLSGAFTLRSSNEQASGHSGNGLASSPHYYPSESLRRLLRS